MRQCVCVRESNSKLKAQFTGSFDQCQDYLMKNRSKYPDMQIYTVNAFQEIVTRSKKSA
jgi:hypothetical protein